MKMAESLQKALFGIADYVYRIWKKIPRTEILNHETTINIPESTVEYSMFVRIPPDFRILRKVIQFSHPAIVRISASCLHPFPRTVREAIKKYIHEDGRVIYALFPERLPQDVDLISMSVWYRIVDFEVLDDLVDSQKAHEPGGCDKNEYWMSAKLKHPKDLVEYGHFTRFDIRDLDITVDVGIHNELKANIPPSFVRRLKTFFEIMSEIDPRRQHMALPQLRKLAKNDTAGREFKLLVDLEALFLPTSFSRFVDVTRDFRYADCYKGKEFYELPIQILPKKMNVISRTDLTLEKPAAEGVLIYKNSLFVEAIKKVVDTSSEKKTS
jgi:hypothetical protein